MLTPKLLSLLEQLSRESKVWGKVGCHREGLWISPGGGQERRVGGADRVHRSFLGGPRFAEDSTSSGWQGVGDTTGRHGWSRALPEHWWM